VLIFDAAQFPELNLATSFLPGEYELVGDLTLRCLQNQ
jgi:hypothetical protein